MGQRDAASVAPVAEKGTGWGTLRAREVSWVSSRYPTARVIAISKNVRVVSMLMKHRATQNASPENQKRRKPAEKPGPKRTAVPPECQTCSREDNAEVPD